MELFLLEHKKLWKKTSTKVCVFLCFLYLVVFGSFLNYQWFSFGSTNPYKSAFGNDFDGYSNIKTSQEFARKYGGELTDETLQQMVKDYQTLAKEEGDKLKYTDWRAVEGWLATLYPEKEKKDLDIYRLIMEYVEPEGLTDFYGRREEAIQNFLENSGQTGKESEYFLKMNEKVETPFKYQWTRGWSELLGYTLDQMGMVLALFLAIVLSGVFAGEWHDNMASMVLTMKDGQKKIACIKALSGILFAVELLGLIFVGIVTAQIIFLGVEGWDMPIQNIKMIAVAPMNMLQAEIYEYAFTFLGAVGFAGVALLISAAIKSKMWALVCSLAVAYAPMVLSEYLPFSLQKVLDLIPLTGSGADIFRTNTFCLFGRYIWSPYLLITVPVLIGVFCIPFGIRAWARKLRV